MDQLQRRIEEIEKRLDQVEKRENSTSGLANVLAFGLSKLIHLIPDKLLPVQPFSKTLDDTLNKFHKVHGMDVDAVDRWAEAGFPSTKLSDFFGGE